MIPHVTYPAERLQHYGQTEAAPLAVHGHPPTRMTVLARLLLLPSQPLPWTEAAHLTVHDHPPKRNPVLARCALSQSDQHPPLAVHNHPPMRRPVLARWALQLFQTRICPPASLMPPPCGTTG